MRRQKHRIAEYQIEANCHVWHIYIGAHQIISHSSVPYIFGHREPQEVESKIWKTANI